MLSIVRNVPFALAPCAGGVLAVAVRAHVARRYMQHVPKATAVGSSDYDADWVSLKRRCEKNQCDIASRTQTSFRFSSLTLRACISFTHIFYFALFFPSL